MIVLYDHKYWDLPSTRNMLKNQNTKTADNKRSESETSHPTVSKRPNSAQSLKIP